MLLKKGSKGSQITTRIFRNRTDGIFGKGTEFEVKEFQKLNGLDVDGIVGL